MKNKRLLLITYHFPPAGGGSIPASLRNAAFCKYLYEFSWEVYVITKSLRNFLYKDDTLPLSNYDKVIRVNDPIPRFKGRDRLSNLLPFFIIEWPWSVKVIINSLRLIRNINPSAILVSGPPFITFLIGFILKKAKNLPLLLDYRDQWTFNPYRMGPKFNKYLDQLIEGFILKNADLIIVTNGNRLKEHLIYWGHKNKNVIVVNNGWENNNPIINNNIKDNSKFYIRHMGAIYGARINPCIKFLDKLSSHILKAGEFKPLVIEFFGYVPSQIKEFRKTLCPRLEVYNFPWINYKLSKIKEREADFLLVITGEHSQNYAEDTSKFYEYLIAGPPIIIIGKPRELYQRFYKYKNIFWLSFDFKDEEIKELLKWMIYIKSDKNIKNMSEGINDELRQFHRRELIKKMLPYLEILSSKNIRL